MYASKLEILSKITVAYDRNLSGTINGTDSLKEKVSDYTILLDTKAKYNYKF